jgi:hypothetical protein
MSTYDVIHIYPKVPVEDKGVTVTTFRKLGIDVDTVREVHGRRYIDTPIALANRTPFSDMSLRDPNNSKSEHRKSTIRSVLGSGRLGINLLDLPAPPEAAPLPVLIM